MQASLKDKRENEWILEEIKWLQKESERGEEEEEEVEASFVIWKFKKC